MVHNLLGGPNWTLKKKKILEYIFCIQYRDYILCVYWVMKQNIFIQIAINKVWETLIVG